jgi:5-carboxymethyl-2-hydroxymuconate isomerase
VMPEPIRKCSRCGRILELNEYRICDDCQDRAWVDELYRASAGDDIEDDEDEDRSDS